MHVEQLGSKVVQVVNTSTGAVNTTAAVIPLDDSIPQIGEGGEFFTATITPRSATNKLLIRAVANFGCGSAGGGYFTGAIFQDAIANALNASTVYIPGSGQNKQVVLEHYMTAGTIVATTFRFRAGANSAITLTLNGQTAARLFGGVYISSITITELRP